MTEEDKDRVVEVTQVTNIEYLETLQQLIKTIKEDGQEKKLKYINYAPNVIAVREKLFEKFGSPGCTRSDITLEDIDIIKRADWIKKGFIGECVEHPKDGSYSDTMLTEIAVKGFEDFCEDIEKIYGVITLSRLIKILTELEVSVKYISFCEARIKQLKDMKE